MIQSYLPKAFAYNHVVGDVKKTIFVEASVVHRVIVAFSQELQCAVGVSLLGDHAMHNWDALSL